MRFPVPSGLEEFVQLVVVGTGQRSDKKVVEATGRL